jgi:hypothetical protein
MANVNLRITVKMRWWAAIAIPAAFALLFLDLIPDAPSAEHWSGRISPLERVTAWIVNRCLVMK